MIQSHCIVVKVGGSLFDLPDLGPRLGRWLSASNHAQVLLIPGGGAAADVVRNLDRIHGLGEEKSHWLALRAMTLNAYLLADLLPGGRVIDCLPACADCWRDHLLPILDAHAFARGDEGTAAQLPHSWDVSSDAIAARVATLAEARQLILLKSVTLPAGLEWEEAGRRGTVDRYFATALPPSIEVRVVNLREWAH